MSERCGLCPRNCVRGDLPGFCGAGVEPYIARCAPHYWEEPVISGQKGSGAIFFSGCTLRCVYCQNFEISKNAKAGIRLDAFALSLKMLELERKGVHNINLVTPTPHILTILEAISKAREAGLTLPIVYNTNSYLSERALKLLDGSVDIYLADLKYVSEELSYKLSGARDYYTHASRAISIMLDQCGDEQYDEGGLLKRGVIIRHLVLPGHIDETRRVLDAIKSLYGTNVQLSLMGQYIPAHKANEYGELKRRLMRREYRRAIDYAQNLGFERVWVQETGSDDFSYIPDWDME